MAVSTAQQPLTPLPLRRWPEAFDHPEWRFELKLDGFRALAYVSRAGVQLVSRAGHVYRGFLPLRTAIAAALPDVTAVLDGELVCLGDNGAPRFTSLLYRRGEPYFYAFDVLSIRGRDLRDRPLDARKRRLRDLLGETGGRLRYLDHVDGDGRALYEHVCARDLEGIVAKWRPSAYRVAGRHSPWLKILNPRYSQKNDRHALFDRFRQD